MDNSDDDIVEVSRVISEDVNEPPLVAVPGFGRMTKRAAIATTASYLRQMAERLEQGHEVPLHYFDMAKDHYLAAIGEERQQLGH